MKEFSSLMLDIKNMFDEDKLFNFMSGLQPWAQTELRMQVVRDLPMAIAAAEGLVDFKFASSSLSEPKKNKDLKKAGPCKRDRGKKGGFAGKPNRKMGMKRKARDVLYVTNHTG